MKTQFKHLTNEQLINLINDKFLNGLNDDDEVKELFRRKKEQNFELIIGFNTYELKK